MLLKLINDYTSSRITSNAPINERGNSCSWFTMAPLPKLVIGWIVQVPGDLRIPRKVQKT